MASNKNNQQKGSGADNSDINKSTASDASDVDWMIMSDLSTRIGGSPQPQKTTIQSTAAKPATQNPTSANLDDDLEDLEWLQSIGLDAEIERSPSPSITVSSTETQNNVENIDWMIVTNLKQRMDDSEIKARAKANLDNIPPPTTVLQSSLDSLSDSLNDDLGLGELNFLEDSDLADLDDLGFDTSDTFDNLDSSSLDFISNDNEQNLLELNSFLEDNFDLSNDLSDELNDLGQSASSDWESIAGFESLDEDLVNQFEEVTTNVNEQIEEPIVDINQQFDQFEESINDVNPQIAQFEEDIVDLSEIYLEEQSVDQDEQFVDYSNLQTDTQSGLAIFNDSFEMETQISAIASVNPEYEPEFNSAIAEVSEEIYTTEELDKEYSEELGLEESAAVFADQIQTNQDIQDIFNNEQISRDAEEFNPLDDSFGEIQDINSLDAAAISDEVWSNSANINIDTDSYDDAFANSWEVDAQNIASSSENIDVSDDAIWGGDILESSSISDKAISNAFEPEEWSVPTSPDYAEPSENEFVYEDLSEIATDQDWSADLEDEIDEISPEVPISETSWDIGNEDSYAQDLEQNFVQDFVQIVDANNELSAEQNSDWILESEQALTTDDLDAGDLSNWQESIEAESAADYYADELDPNSYDLGWEQLPVADEDVNALEPLEILAENAAVDSFETDNFIGEENIDENINEDFDFQDSLDDANLESQNDDDWAIAEASLDYASADSSFVDNFVQDEFTDTYESLSEPLMEELEIPQSDLSLANNSVDNFEEDFDQDFAAAIADQITGSGFNNDLDSYTAYPLQSELNPIPAPNNYPENNLSSAQTDELESILDEDFDLATFDDDSLIDYPLSEDNNIATMLTPVRPNSANTQANVGPNAISHDQQEPFPSALDLDDFGLEDEFERAIANDSLEDEFAAELGIEESLANEMLNGNGVSADFSPNLNLDIPSPSFDSGASVNSFPTPPVGSSYDSNDHDFLDDFDLDSIGTAFDSDEFDSNFINPVISTGLTPPAPPSQPTPVPSPALPTINNNPPPPPPFMLPLPPKRSTAQPKQANPTSGRPLTTPNQTSGGAVSIDDRNFDSFHNDHHDSSKFKNNKSISSIDEGWSDLLDADTVLSDVLPSPMDSRTINPSQMANIPPRPMMNTGNPSQGRSPENSSTSARRKQPRLPDFDELGLEVHDDNNDWSGLLESGDLSDNITTISPSTTPLSSRGQQPIARRSDITSVSETREIPRDRRSPQVTNFGDATQARMAAHPDQIDFNRFTEDNYDRYEPPSNFPEAAPSKSQATKPSISLESLWQNYLKFPAMGLGAIGAALLLYTVMNRPVFELGLRWGIFKDARGLDFTNADFRGAKLDNVDFSKAILTKAKMQDASLEGANFQDANLDGVSFVKANLNQAKLVGTSVVWSEFRDAQMRFVDFSGADLTRSNFSGANLTGASFRGTKIGAQGTDKATKLPPINLLAWQIVNQPLEGRNLANKNLSGLNLSFSNLKRANLTKARLNFTDLAEADLRGANLTGGQLDGANLNGAKLNGINLTGVKFDKSKLPKTDAQTVCPDGKNGPCKF